MNTNKALFEERQARSSAPVEQLFLVQGDKGLEQLSEMRKTAVVERPLQAQGKDIYL